MWIVIVGQDVALYAFDLVLRAQTNTKDDARAISNRHGGPHYQASGPE